MSIFINFSSTSYFYTLCSTVASLMRVQMIHMDVIMNDDEII